MKTLIVPLLMLSLTACDNNTAKEQARHKQIEALRKHSQVEIERYNRQKNKKFEEPDFSNLFKKKE